MVFTFWLQPVKNKVEKNKMKIADLIIDMVVKVFNKVKYVKKNLGV